MQRFPQNVSKLPRPLRARSRTGSASISRTTPQIPSISMEMKAFISAPADRIVRIGLTFRKTAFVAASRNAGHTFKCRHMHVYHINRGLPPRRS